MTHDIKFPDEREEETKEMIEIEALKVMIQNETDYLEQLQAKYRKLVGQNYRVTPKFMREG